MKVQLLLPVHVYRVFYQVGRSRPATKLEQLVLQAIGEGCSDLDRLEQVFHLHQRVLMEVVITLFQAGKLCLDENRLVLQTAGAGLVALSGDASGLSGEAADAERVPTLAHQAELQSEFQEETQDLVEERVLGQLCRQQWVRYQSLDRTSLDLRGRLMPAGDLPPELQAGRCIPFLYASQPEEETKRYLQAIVRTELLRAHRDVVLVEVDTDQGTVQGLPKPWRAQLRDPLLQFAEKELASKRVLRPARAVRLDLPASREGTYYWEGKAAKDEVVLRRSVPPEDTALCQALRSDSISHLMILSKRLSRERVDVLIPLIEAAVQRGVQIDLLWGTSPAQDQVIDEASHRKAIERLRELARAGQRAHWPGSLSVSEQPSELHTNLLFSTHRSSGVGRPTFEATFATQDWLTEGPCGDEIRNMSRGLVQSLCMILLDVVMGDPVLAQGATPTRLANVRDLLGQQLSQSEPAGDLPLRLRLWLDRAHVDPELSDLAELAQQSEINGLLQHGQRSLLTSFRFGGSPTAVPKHRGYAGDLGIEVQGSLGSQEEPHR